MTRTILFSMMLSCTAVAHLRAQNDSLPFHRGQWGVSLNGLGASGAGILRFRNPGHAWVFDVGASLSRNHARYDTSGVIAAAGTETQYAISTRLGLRSYKSIGTRVDRQFTVGIVGRYGHDLNNNSGYQTALNSLGAGVFAELGGEWLVTPHLGLGASWAAQLEYSWSHSRTPANDGQFASWNLSAGMVQVHSAFYF